MTISDLERPDVIASVRCTDRDLVVSLTDGRTVSAPLWCYPRLLSATPEQRENFEIGRFGIHWPEIDEDIELAGLLLDAKAPGATPPVEGVRERLRLRSLSCPPTLRLHLPWRCANMIYTRREAKDAEIQRATDAWATFGTGQGV